MAKHIVKCAICGQTFDLNSIQGVRHGARRYSHYSCEPTGELVPMEIKKEDPDLVQLNNYINELFKDQANWAMIKKQIKTYTNDMKYSYSGILKSLIYFYEVKNNPIDKSNGSIGIVPFVYKDAYNYYLSIFLANDQNKNITFIQKVKEYIIQPPKKRGTKNKLLDWSEDIEE